VQALFNPDGDHLVPTELTRGPWRPDAQHGGPPAAVLGRAAEAEADAGGGTVARIGVELVRPVPLRPLRVASRVERVSRRVSHVHAELSTDDDEVVARARALVLHVSDLDPVEVPVTADLPGPESEAAAPRWTVDEDVVAYHRDAVEHRFAAGGFDVPGPAVDWIRLRFPVVAGEQTSGLCRALAVADFGSGISAVFTPGSEVALINADLTVAVHRPPRGEWVRLASATRLGPSGVGLCTTELSDLEGPVGAASQSLMAITAPGRA
jgi:hypothetical protein